MPEILPGTDDQRRLVVVVKGAQADQVGAVALQFHPARFGETLERDLLLEPFDYLIGDAGHWSPFVAFSGLVSETCQEPYMELL